MVRHSTLVKDTIENREKTEMKIEHSQAHEPGRIKICQPLPCLAVFCSCELSSPEEKVNVAKANNIAMHKLWGENLEAVIMDAGFMRYLHFVCDTLK